ncbi:MAG TPA: acyl carrier protein [Polyangiaceae bacterium]|jgi:acyl carrier protein|nr:acyl carrier protein [Polyangiaceae bacterium]
MDEELRAKLAERERVIAKIQSILVDDLHVGLPPEAIDLDAALFGTGLALDSVDALELVVSAEAAFGVRFPEETLRTSLRTVNALADLVLDLRKASS